jgi:hypothetical protein
MADPISLDSPLEGCCLCGAVTVRLAKVQPGVDVCQCDMCQKWCGGPLFSLHGVRQEDFTLEGEGAIRSYRSSEWAERASCTKCGSNLWYHFVPGGTWSFTAGLFALPADWGIDEQIFIDEMPPYAEIAAPSSKKTGAEVIAEAKEAGFDFG